MNRRFVLVALILIAAAPALAAEKADRKKGGGENFIQLPTLTATVLKPGGERGVITVEVGVDVPDAGLRRRAQQSIPLLRDAFTREMLTYAPSLAAGGAPNPDIISIQLQRAADRTLGRSGAKVLLGTILIN
jgi:hypothetical protein